MVNGVRWSNPSSLKGYIDSQGSGFRVIEDEDAKNRFNDVLITSLRTSRGLDPDMVPEEFRKEFEQVSSRLILSGKLIHTPQQRLAIPEDKWLTSNNILLDLIVV